MDKLGRFYLAGPIRKVSEEWATVWREKAIHDLAKIGFDSLSPMHRTNLSSVQIVEQDLRDIQLATAVLAYVPEDIVTIGTPMEIFYANYVLNKPVIVFGVNVETLSPWIKEHCISWNYQYEEAIDFIRKSNILYTEQDPCRRY